MDDSYRPVRLRKVVLGYPFSENSSGFRFEMGLNYKLSSLIATYSDRKPTLVVFICFLPREPQSPYLNCLIAFSWQHYIGCLFSLNDN